MQSSEVTGYGWDQDMPMSLPEKLKTDLKSAMLHKDAEVRSAIRQVMSEYPKLTVPITLESGKKTTRPKKPEEITDDDVIGIVKGLIKSEKTVLELKKEDSSPYLRVLEMYLPKLASREEITAWISENVDFSKLKNSMQAMGPVMKHFGKLADANLVKTVLAEFSG